MAITVITVANQKGGAGKTNTVIQLAVQMEARGYGPVALLDTDAPQGSLSMWFNRRNSELETPLMAGLKPGQKIKDKIAQLEQSGVNLLIIDTPAKAPQVQVEVADAILASDLVVIPTQPTVRDLEALPLTFQFAKKYGKQYLFVMNAVVYNRSITPQIMSTLAQQGPLSTAMLYNRVAHVNSDALGLSTSELEPRNKAVAEIETLISDIEKFIPRWNKPKKERRSV